MLKKEIITPAHRGLAHQWNEIWNYRDLLRMLVRRDFVAFYKQTVLGPIWFVLQPLLMTLIFALVFGRFAKIDTGAQPKLLFYFSGMLAWGFFSDTLIRTSSVFRDNMNLFGKVYFPRLIVPLAIVATSGIRLFIQAILFLVFHSYFYWNNYPGVSWHFTVVAMPFYLLILALMALGIGLIMASLSAKYRDLLLLLGFGVQVLMYASPIIYSVYSLPAPYQNWMRLNPLNGVLEAIRFTALPQPSMLFLVDLAYSAFASIGLFFMGLFFFSRTERSVMDTV